MTTKGWWVSVPGARRVGVTLARALNKHVYIQINFQAGKLQMKSRNHKVSVNSNNLSIDYKKTATGNGNLQPGVESSECSSSK